MAIFVERVQILTNELKELKRIEKDVLELMQIESFASDYDADGTIQMLTSIKEKIKEKQNLLFNMCRKVEKNSKFQTTLISDALSQLMSEIEGTEFSYYQGNFYFEESMVTEEGEEKIPQWHQTKLITAKENASSNIYFQFPSVNQLVEDKKALVLACDKQNSHKNSLLSFYRAFYVDECFHLESKVDFGKFDYVQEFIDQIIEYQILSGKSQISKKELMFLMKKFVLLYVLDRMQKNIQSQKLTF